MSEEESIEAQFEAIHSLSHEVQAKIGTNVTDPAVWRGLHICTYLSAMWGSSRGMSQKKTIQLRKRILRDLDFHFGRNAIADDFVATLSQNATLPDFFAEMVRKDLELIRSR